MKLGFIGLGKMGKPMAANLIKQGHELKIYNRSRQVLDELEALGAVPVAGPAEAGIDSEVVFTNLPIGKDVENVVCGPAGLLTTMPGGGLIIDHSTIGPRESCAIYEACQAKGIGFIDAPVSGGVVGAQNASLSIMVGGDEADYQRALPLLSVLGKHIYYLGASGSGSVMKLLNNMLVGVTNAAVAEVFVLGAKKGLDPELVFEILSKSSGDSSTLRRNMPGRILARNFAPAFTLDMLNKDMGLVRDLAASEGVRLLLGNLAHEIGCESAAQGLGAEDISALIKTLEKLSGVEVAPYSNICKNCE